MWYVYLDLVSGHRVVCVSRPLGVDIVWYVYLDLVSGHRVVCRKWTSWYVYLDLWEWTSCGMCI